MTSLQTFARPVDFFGRRNLLAAILGMLAAPAAALLGSKADADDATGATLSEPFKSFVRTFNVGGLGLQVVTEWWNGRPADLDAIEDPEEPGVWITQRIVTETGNAYHPRRLAG